MNILVSGGTGSGKTSLLNALSSLIPNDNRIIVIEDSAELQLQQSHILSFETQTADKQGKGEVSIRDLLISSLRLRPDRIVIGEIRGGEALDFLQALNTGHGGSMGTVHANSPMESLSRIETLTLFAGLDLPIMAIRQQVSSAINIVVQTSKYNDGSRKISHISEVESLIDGEYRVTDIFRFKQNGINNEGKIMGILAPTGEVPANLKLYLDYEFSLPESLTKCWHMEK
jgi:pilus assembly protein CpaF